MEFTAIAPGSSSRLTMLATKAWRNGWNVACRMPCNRVSATSSSITIASA
jgi:hypothetical protein